MKGGSRGCRRGWRVAIAREPLTARPARHERSRPRCWVDDASSATGDYVSGEPRRRLILHMSVSLDGFSASRRETRGSVDRGAARHHANLEMLGQAGLIGMGRGA